MSIDRYCDDGCHLAMYSIYSIYASPGYQAVPGQWSGGPGLHRLGRKQAAIQQYRFRHFANHNGLR